MRTRRWIALRGSLLILFMLSCPFAANAKEGAPEGSTPSPGPAQPPSALPAEMGNVSGRVIDALSEGPMEGVCVSEVGSEDWACTDDKGRFTLELPAGRRQLEVRFDSYKTIVIPDVIIEAGKETRLPSPLRLAPDTTTTEVAVDVVREPDRNSTEAQNLVRRNSSRVSDIVSAEDIKKSADGSASQAASRVVGATVVGDRFVYVRGLGERYANALFNGAPLPSPEPDQQAIPFDIFPASFLANLTIAKSASADLPGDFAGGSVQINTQEFPTRLRLGISLSGSANLSTALQPYLSYPGGRLDFLGFDDGTRGIPRRAYPGFMGDLYRAYGENPRLYYQKLAEVARAFQNTWSPRESHYAPVNHAISASIGNQHRSGERRLGYLFSLSYGQEYQTREQQIVVFNLDDGKLDPQVGLSGRLSLHEVQWGGLGHVTLDLASHHRVSVAALFTQNADDEARILSGPSVEARSEVFTTRLRFIERTFGFLQLGGTSRFDRAGRLGAGDVDWRITYARASRREPDNREVFRIRGDDGRDSFTNSGNSGQRFFSENQEDQVAAGLDYTQAFRQWARLEARFKLGALFRYRLRDFSARRFQFFSYGRDAAGMEIDTLPSEDLFAPANLSEENGVGVELRENTNAADRYTGRMGVYAAYALLDLPLHPRLRLSAGLRFEAAQQRIESMSFDGKPVRPALDNYDPLPSLNLLYQLRDTMNLRVAVSMTVARPEFRELSPFQFTDFYGGELVRGNPDLKRSRIVNGDLRWEWFLGAADLLAASAFFKYFDQPIESTISPGSTLIRSFANAPSAYNVGLELEGRKDALSSLADKRHGLTFGGNVSIIHSQVDLSGVTGVQTSTKRPLQGQSPFVVNVFIEYERRHPRYATHARVLYNVFGERIDQVGALGLPDRYQQPRHMLDATLTQELGRGFALRLSARNLLDSPVEITQAGETTLLYRTGRVVGLTLSYNN